jgi:hypothetical protein
VIDTAQYYVLLAVGLVAFGLSLWSLVDAATRPPAAFTSAGKRTKTFWVVLTAIATALTFVGVGGGLSFFTLGSAIVAGIYLADVRPAVQPYSRRRGPGGSGGTPSRGGW